VNDVIVNWRWRPWIRIMLCLLVGVAVGLGSYQLTVMDARQVFAACGGAVGLLVGAVLYGHRRSVRLTDITVAVPQFSQLHFAVTRESQHMAWKLFVELVTRISTQPLDADGRLRSALTSMHGLLAFTRDLLKQNPPSRQTGSDPTVEQLAITMLNCELRPFLTHWHRMLAEWQEENPGHSERDWPLNEECRAELIGVQHRLREYVLSFGELASVPNAQQIVAGTLTSPVRMTNAGTAQINKDG
jgi:hypothetical protein